MVSKPTGQKEIMDILAGTEMKEANHYGFIK